MRVAWSLRRRQRRGLAALGLAASCLVACSRGPAETALPDGHVGVSYEARIPGASAAAIWSVTGGSLPDGLALDPVTASVRGTPTRAGHFAFVVAGRDRASAAAAGAQRLTLQVLDVVAAVTAAPVGPRRWSGTYDYRLSQP